MIMEGKNMSDKKSVQIMKYDDDFYKITEESGLKIVLYGIGAIAEKVFPYLKKVDYVCDRRANEVKAFHHIKVFAPEELENIGDKLAILICVKEEKYRQQIKVLLQELCINAKVFDLYNSISFNTYKPTATFIRRKVSLKKVRLICPDEGWILNKFAKQMKSELLKQGISADIGRSIDTEADINHHISFHIYEPLGDYNDTLMITHVDSMDKVNLLKHQLQVAKMGICMSRDTMNQLISMGIPREKICYINPAQDGVIKPRKYVLGITHRIHSDHRKRASALIDICDSISPDYFEFKIMGDGWDEIVEKVREKGFTVKYYNDFDYDTYVDLVPSLDYYLYWGFDEGSMGYLDALAAGVETIVTPQGYHLDTRCGLTHPCRTVQDFVDTLLHLEEQKKRRVDAVSDWTWSNYVMKHIEVWKYLLGDDDIYQNKHRYEDGVFSMMCIDA